MKLFKRKPKKKNLRLLITDKCERNCEGCCNHQFDLRSLPQATFFGGYRMILITGGEPVLLGNKLKAWCKFLQTQSDDKTKLVLYTADLKTDPRLVVVLLEDYLYGITVTLHEQNDVSYFLSFAEIVNRYFIYHGKSLRLNVFKGVVLPNKKAIKRWKIQKDMEWLNPCPIPKNEVFMKFY